ncbi:MAG TPA: hypothetical protein DCQ98_04160 [Planctomycetaceae bacterium]|nr:hypothetical protein [Planctomycetaceae bacterium]HRF00019.1 HTTM domain-containing protein [Pirellulaceae bacterium]
MAIDEGEFEGDERSGFRKALDSVFGIDARSLALFRMVIALLVLVDIYVRWPTLADFQTDDGAFSRAACLEFYEGQGIVKNGLIPDQPLPLWSWHLISGQLWLQQTLVGMQAGAAILLLFGFRTRLMTFVVWLLMISLHVRNPIVLNSGDTLLRMLLFWAIFLPLGARWSFDKLMRPAARLSTAAVTSVASAAILIQLCVMYWFTGIAKSNELWFTGRALENVLELDLLTRPWGKRLLAYPDLMRWFTLGTVYGELILPCLLFIPWRTHWFRLLNIAIAWVFHLGIVLTMSVGLFSAISMAAWLLFLPRQFWDSTVVRGLLGSLLGSASMVESDAVGRRVAIEDETPAWKRYGGIALQSFVGLVLVYVICWNLSRVRPDDPILTKFMPKPIQGPGQMLMLAQEFKMFDQPPALDFWFVYEARLRNGQTLDLFSGKPIEGEGKPKDIFSRYRDHRWRRLHANLMNPEYVMLRRPLTEFLVRRWNETHSSDFQVSHVTMRFFQRFSNEAEDDQHIVSENWVDITVDDESPIDGLLQSLESGGRLLP